MLSSRYNIKWVARCQYGTSDKIWGWFVYNDPTDTTVKEPPKRWQFEDISFGYVFWGATGKTLQFKRHEYNKWQFERLQSQKIERKYNKIEVRELEGLWDNLYETINNKFVFHLLANDI